jgi:RimJ/RimL family protein N-acetyltransferase
MSKLLHEFKTHPELIDYISFPAVETAEDMKREYYDKYFNASTTGCLYAIRAKTVTPDKDDPWSNFAGILSMLAKEPENASIEMGIMTFTPYHRTHVARNAVGLAMLWMMDPPSAGGLGSRRVEWRAHASNDASTGLATKMGFQLEGIMRWESVTSSHEVGLPVDRLRGRNGTKEEARGKHTALLSIVWDEWEEKRPNVIAQMDRRK